MPGIMVSASTGAMNSLLGKLTTLMGEEFAKLKNLRKEVKFISDELGSMKDALERLADVEELDPQTKSWRNTLREISYDIEDIIDDFMQNIGEKHKNSGFVRKTVRRLKTLRFRHRIAGHIKEIKKLVHETNDRRKRYQLDNIIPPSSNSVDIDPRVKTLYEKAANFIGMEGPKNELVNWLKVEEKQLKVVTIVGFGGLGKTTLANEVYHMLRGEFDCGAFVPVSQKPNVPHLLRGLLSQLGVEPSIHACESQIIDKLREHLQTKRYLIIIDDLWDASAWDIIKCAFPENDLCSRVIATTRIENVATACCSHRRDHILKMKPLGDEDSRRLFFDRIFGSEEACPPHLGDVSVEILKKCSGLPLAIISISSMLASDGSSKIERWEDVHNSLYSGTNLTLEGMGQILNLSYKDLPCHLKTCLLFLGMYPEDYIIQSSDQQCQWMAEGFIHKENGQDVEKVARNYFNELVNRSLIQPIVDNRGSVTQCRVHDLMLDLILLKCKEENFLTIVNGRQAITGLDYKVRRLSIRMDGAINDRRLLPRNISMTQVRSVMFFGGSQNQNTPPLFEFKFLRVLFIDVTHGTVNLNGLCKLYQLRYLRIRCSCPYRLPIHIRVLQDLETLDLFNCYNLPSDIVHLPRLMHLNVNTWLPDGIGNMKSLQHLDLFDFVSNTIDDIYGLGELINLRYLILGGGHPPDDKERRMNALCSSLGKLFSLEYLYVNLKDCIDGLMPLSPPTPYRLERLILSHKCWFSRVPSWLGQLRNLCELQCQVVELLNDGVGVLAELPVLTDLDIRILENRNEMIVIYGRAFPALKHFSLLLSSASDLTFQAGSMSKLQRLKLMFSANGSEQNGIAPAGIEHLLSLEELSAQIHYNGAWESDKTSIEYAFRSAVRMHPSSPRLEIWVD